MYHYSALIQLLIVALTSSVFAYTNLETPSYLTYIPDDTSIPTSKVTGPKKQSMLRVSTHNSIDIATNYQFWGRSLSGNQVGTANQNMLIAEKGNIYTFLEVDLFSYNSNIPATGTGNSIVSSGGMMSGSTIGTGMYLNAKQSHAIGLSQSIYQWPDQQWYYWASSTTLTPLSSVSGGTSNVKPVKAVNLHLMLYNFAIFYSAPTTSNSTINPNDTSQTAWPHNWGTYFSIRTPSYPIRQKINISGLYGTWNNTGDVFQIDISRPINKNTRGTVRGYSFNSNDNNIDSNNGLILSMQFSMNQPIFSGTT